MRFPTVHSNGTSRDGLVNPLIAAIESLNVAIGKLGETMPHGRDYYVQDEASPRVSAIDEAVQEYRARMRALTTVRDELQTIAENI